MNFKQGSTFLIISFLLIFYTFSLESCKKEEPLNPFDRENPTDTLKLDSLYNKSIEGLYNNIFKPNCSTSGCHDGTFDPDFRTIQSSYNTLVWSNIINNDPNTPLTYRVEPNNADHSMLIKRLTSFVQNTSGIMPLEVSPDSDWNTKKEAYIQDLKDWINDGAKDIFGNAANAINLKPQLAGFNITPNGSNTIFQRNANGIILIPNSENSVTLYFSLIDKETITTDLSVINVEVSNAQNNFLQASSFAVQTISPINQIGYYGTMTPFYHKVVINDLNTIINTDSYGFIRITVSDDLNLNTELPGQNTLDYIKAYYSFKRIP